MQGLIPQNKERTEFSGFIEAKGQSFRIDISLPDGPNSISSARIQCDWRLHKALEKHLNFLKERLKSCSNIEIYLNEIQELLELVDNPSNQELCSPVFYSTVIKHLQEVGFDAISDISKDFKVIEIKVLDPQERTHNLTLNLPSNYPNSSPTVNCIVPHEFVPVWTHDSDLSSIISQFQTWLTQYQCLWDNVDELKERSWILEPENPNRAASSLRIGLGNGSSVQIKVDPLAPQGQPECHFLGADWAIVPIQQKFYENLENWNEELSVYQNLCTVLDMELPVRRTTNSSQDMTLQCGICYSYRLGVCIPDQICNDKRCNQAFHHACLLEWIKSVSGSKQSFNSLFGECPYCTRSMKIKLVHE